MSNRVGRLTTFPDRVRMSQSIDSFPEELSAAGHERVIGLSPMSRSLSVGVCHVSLTIDSSVGCCALRWALLLTSPSSTKLTYFRFTSLTAVTPDACSVWRFHNVTPRLLTFLNNSSWTPSFAGFIQGSHLLFFVQRCRSTWRLD